MVRGSSSGLCGGLGSEPETPNRLLIGLLSLGAWWELEIQRGFRFTWGLRGAFRGLDFLDLGGSGIQG